MRGLQESRLNAPRVVGENMFSLVKSDDGAWHVLEISPDAASLSRTVLKCDTDDISKVETAYESFLATR